MNRAIFLDRDGTLIKQVGDIATHRPKDLKFIPWAIIGLSELSELGYKLIIITNQSGIGVGKYTERQFKRTMKYMYKQFKKYNKKYCLKINVEKKYYYCSHHPDAKCHCRKPEPGMLEQAIKDYNLNPWECWMIEDKGKGVDAGASVGCKTILVETGAKGKDKLSITTPDYKVEDLLKAAYKIKEFDKK